MNAARVLFVTWDGPQLSYLESLFLPIFERLQQHGYSFDVLQFRWGDEARTEAVRRLCRDAGVGYQAVRVPQGLGSIGAFLTAVHGGLRLRRAVRKHRSEVVLVRGMMPALTYLASRRASGAPMVFDADGLPADERVEFANLPPEGGVYRILRDIEAQAVRLASAVLVRTEPTVDILVNRAGPPVTSERFFKVTNGRDPAVFHPESESARGALRDSLGIGHDAPVIVYAGSVGAQYRFNSIGKLVAAVRQIRPDVHLLVLTGSPEIARTEILSQYPELDLLTTTMRVPPSEVPRYLAAADLGTAFRSPSFSMVGVAPVKISEYLLCGLPIAGTGTIGDTAAAVSAGVFHDESVEADGAAAWFCEQVMPQREAFRSRAREVGVATFSVDESVAGYLAALRSIPQGPERKG